MGNGNSRSFSGGNDRSWEGHQANLAREECGVILFEEEQRLAYEYQQGNREAGNKLVTAYQRLVTKMANDYGKSGVPKMDLIQEGNLGLLRAVEKFNPERGNRFITYASWWIKAFMSACVLNNLRSTKMLTTRNKRKLFYQSPREIEAFEKKHGRAPTSAELAILLESKEEEVEDVRQWLQFEVSLDSRTVKDVPGSPRWVDCLPDQNGETPEEAVSKGRNESRRILSELLTSLEKKDPRSVKVIRLHHLGEEEKPLTLREIGEGMGITRERVRQLEARGMQAIRANARSLKNGSHPHELFTEE